MPVQSDLRFTFSAGNDEFEVVEFRLREGLSETFRLDIDLSCSNPAVDFSTVFYHPDLPQHPDIKKAIAQVRAGDGNLLSHFTKYTPNDWKRIFAELPRAKDYS